jgi:probable HAF family extracellular repeat protein
MFTKHRSLLVFILTGLGWFSPSHAQSFRGLGDLPGGAYHSSVTAISADGRVIVGTSWSTRGNAEGFRWENGTMSPFGGLQGLTLSSFPRSLSADGSIIVGTAYDNPSRAFRWENGVMSYLGNLGNIYQPTNAYAISSDGSTIVGDNSPEAFRWRNGVMIGLGDLPGGAFGSVATAVSADGGIIVGFSYSGSFSGEAFRWENGVMTGLGVLPGASSSHAYAVSASGNVVVGESTRPNDIEAFRWENGVMTGLGALPTSTLSISRATGVSADGRIIVGKSHVDGSMQGSQAVVWFEVGKPLNLREYAITTLGLGTQLAGWYLREATAISADGRWITGNGTNPQGLQEAWLLQIPASAGTLSAPVITTHPANQSSTTGALVTFTAAASGNPSPTFQWQRDGVNIAGATNASLTLSNVTSSDAGSYVVIATNSVGFAMSSSATLTVSAAPVTPTPPTTPTTPTVPVTPPTPAPSGGGGGGGGAHSAEFIVLLLILAISRRLSEKHRSIV